MFVRLIEFIDRIDIRLYINDMNTSTDNISLQQANEKITQRFITAVYGWMVAALAISGVAAFAVFNSRALATFIFGNRFTFMGLIIAEFALVLILSAGIRKMSFAAAAASFIINCQRINALSGAFCIHRYFYCPHFRDNGADVRCNECLRCDNEEQSAISR